MTTTVAKCEGCGAPATKRTGDDVELCDACYAEVPRVEACEWKADKRNKTGTCRLCDGSAGTREPGRATKGTP
jgi:hypothetical protein